jgi:hypothetical protein
LLVVKCIFMVVTWRLGARFLGGKIFLFFEVYFGGVANR